MTTWVVTPVKAPEVCKTRLAPVLGDAERQAVVAAMLTTVVTAARSAEGVDEVLLLGPSDHGLRPAPRRLDDPGGGLNAALAAALTAASAANADRLVILAGDLPNLAALDVEALAQLGPDELGVAPDRAGVGTNALSLPLPQASDFRFRYGDESCTRHQAEAERLGLTVRIIRSPGLELDVDAPGDLAAVS